MVHPAITPGGTRRTPPRLAMLLLTGNKTVGRGGIVMSQGTIRGTSGECVQPHNYLRKHMPFWSLWRSALECTHAIIRIVLELII